MRNTILIIIGFVFYYLGFKQFEPIMLFIDQGIHYRLASYFFTYIIIGLPLFIITCIINKRLNFFYHLGLQPGILKGLVAGLIFTLPMFAGCAFLYKPAAAISMPNMIAKTVLDPFFEELFFRGYFFGLLFRYTKLGFIPSILICSLVFAAGHLYQSHEPMILFGIFITTFSGSVLFAWLYAEWNFNLWVPVFLHILMNVCWYIFSISNNALGTIYPNVLRGLTIAFSIILTLMYKKRKGEKILVNKLNLFLIKAGGNNADPVKKAG